MANVCVQCTSNNHCTESEFCNDALFGGDLFGGDLLGGDFQCHPKIATGEPGCWLRDEGCVSGRCAATESNPTGECVACNAHSDCTDSQYCDTRVVGGSFTCVARGGQHADCSGSYGLGRDDRKCQSPLECATTGGHCECKSRQACIEYMGTENTECSIGYHNTCTACNGRNAVRSCAYSSIGEATLLNCCSGSVYQSTVCNAHWAGDDYWFYCS